ncbi:glycosyltransferase family 2 protein [Olivibacter sitiensis]|uniref:glycosyltransferase family 2 protein n=1 Tax=Olivibacter sitiensis TaxID=376470 RepID=UPI000400A4CF|nr:glycosyltransferase [Olivibacter sitiensis]
MNEKLKISVVIPMFNAEETIAHTVQSVFEQEYLPYELIVVDDGSTDGSKKLVEHLFSEYEGGVDTKLLAQPNGGVSKARNRGMAAAKGDYIALLDADDRWLPNKLSRQVAIMQEHPSIDFLGCNRNGEHWDRWLFQKFEQLTPISARLLLYKTFFVTPTVLFKRELLQEIGYFDEQQRYAEEGNYWIRISARKHCVLLNESLVITGNGKPHFGHSGLSSNLKEMEKGELRNMKLGYQLGVVGKIEYFFLVFYSLMKYLRRFALVKWRKI